MIFFSNPEKNFTMVQNDVLQDKNLSLQARAIYCIIRSFGFNWNINRNHLSEITGLSKNTLNKYILELKEADILSYVQNRDKQGKFNHKTDYIFNDALEEVNITLDSYNEQQLQLINESIEARYSFSDEALLDNAENKEETPNFSDFNRNANFGRPNFESRNNIIEVNKTYIFEKKESKKKTNNYALINLKKLNDECLKALQKLKENKSLQRVRKQNKELEESKAFFSNLNSQEISKYHDFIAHRVMMNNDKALKQTTLKAIQKNLLRLKLELKQDIVLVMQKSIDRGWIGLFPIQSRKLLRKQECRQKAMQELHSRYNLDSNFSIEAELERIMNAERENHERANTLSINQ